MSAAALEARQLELFAGAAARTPEALLACLGGGGAAGVRLTITRNRAAMASVRFRGAEARVRLDAAFLGAPARVLEALGAYLRTRRAAEWREVASFARGIAPAARPAGPARAGGDTAAGEVYDLAAVRERVNARHFGGRLRCRISWGPPPRAGRRRGCGRSIRYGCYVRADNRVLVNRRLDDRRVPAEFVEYIVFHEMLHAAVPSRQGKRWNHHTAAYRALERGFPDVERMRGLADRLVDVLRRR